MNRGLFICKDIFLLIYVCVDVFSSILSFVQWWSITSKSYTIVIVLNKWDMTSFKSAVKQVIYLLKLLREDMFLYFLFWFCFYLQCEDEVATVIVYLHGVFLLSLFLIRLTAKLKQQMDYMREKERNVSRKMNNSDKVEQQQ